MDDIDERIKNNRCPGCLTELKQVSHKQIKRWEDKDKKIISTANSWVYKQCPTCKLEIMDKVK